VDVTGQVTTTQAAGTNRTIQLGGSAQDNVAPGGSNSAAGQASVISVDVTAGGRLLMPNSILNLRAAKIGVARAAFLTEVGLTPAGAPLATAAVQQDYIGNSGSTLYNPGAPTGNDVVNGDVITALHLNITYTDYALFQNTALGAALPRGVTIGSLGLPNTLALNSTGDSAPNGLALFGQINGRGGAEAALFGQDVIILNGANRNNTRINGCLVGSAGGGCLISSVAPPQINLFDDSQADLIRAENALPLSFDPVIGANNEALFSGTADMPPDDPRCERDEDGSPCPETQEDQE
jgi:hypothetical protein